MDAWIDAIDGFTGLRLLTMRRVPFTPRLPDRYRPPRKMLVAFESILPIFLLILLGNLLRRTPLVEAGAWRGLEQLGYWFLYPALLFVTILNADLSTMAVDAMMAALLLSVLAMCLITGALWPVLSRVRADQRRRVLVGVPDHDPLERLHGAGHRPEDLPA